MFRCGRVSNLVKRTILKIKMNLYQDTEKVSNLVKRTILKIRYSFYQVNITIYKV